VSEACQGTRTSVCVYVNVCTSSKTHPKYCVRGPFFMLPKGGDALSSAHNAPTTTTSRYLPTSLP
jgi:hypothetical protein